MRVPAASLLEVGRPDVLAAGLDDRFQRWPHTRLLSRKFRDLCYGDSPRQIWTMQPQLGKTTVGSIWGPVWALDWDPHLQLMLLSYSARLAERNAGLCRNMLRDHHKHLRTSLRADSTQKAQWNTQEGGGLMASGVDGSIHGFSGTIIIIDDPHKNRREANSAHRRQQVWEWWTDDVQSRLQGEERVLIVMTRWHVDDLVARVIKHEGLRKFDEHGKELLGPDGKPFGDWELTHLPALADPTICDPDPLGREPGEPVCPERFSKAVMERRRTSVGPIAWASLYQGVPTVAEGDLLKRSWWRLTDALPQTHWGDLIITSWDLAGGSDDEKKKKAKKRDEGSWTVGQVWMKDHHSGRLRYTLLDQVRGRWNYPEQLRAIKGLAAKHPYASHHLIENASNGRAAIQALQQDMTGIVAINPGKGGSKEDRAEATTAVLEAGFVYLPNWVGTDSQANDQATWVDGFINECADFPNGENDDQVDAYSQAIQYLTRFDQAQAMTGEYTASNRDR